MAKTGRRTLSRMTAAEVKANSKKEGRHPDGQGLYLHVKGGSASWVYRYKVGTKEKNMGLGPLHSVSLAEARQRAAGYRKMRYAEEPRDPLDERRANRSATRLASAKAMTFKECAIAYIGAHRSAWRNPKHAAQWSSTLEKFVFPLLGDLPVSAIDTALVMKVLDPIWTVTTETASRVRGRIEAVLNWATVSEYRQGENPARWRGHLEHKLPKKTKVRAVEHHAALAFEKLPDFMEELRQQKGIPARALEFVVLTAARSGECLGATWSEIDLVSKTWTIPAGRMKAGKEHRVPLSGPAIAILQGLPVTGDRVFPISGSSMTRRMGRNGLTVHGFRSCFSDWTAEQTNFPAELREMALAHAIGNKVEEAYRRGDLFQKRRQLMEAWGAYCANLPPDDNVVTLPRRAV